MDFLLSTKSLRLINLSFSLYNKKYFTVCLYDNNGNIFTIARETSIKKAQQLASKLGLYKLNELSDYQMTDYDLELIKNN